MQGHFFSPEYYRKIHGNSQKYDARLHMRQLAEDCEHDVDTIFEFGALKGASTKDYLAYCNVITVTDNPFPNDETLRIAESEGRLKWIFGLSQIELKKYEDRSMSFVVIDSDHNYSTLKAELEELKRTVKIGGIVCIHDVEFWRNKNGVSKPGVHIKSNGTYMCGEKYDTSLMASGPGYTQALLEEIKLGHWKVIRWCQDGPCQRAFDKIPNTWCKCGNCLGACAVIKL